MGVIRRVTTKAKRRGSARPSPRNSYKSSRRTSSWTPTLTARTWSGSPRSPASARGWRRSGSRTAGRGRRSTNTLGRESRINVSNRWLWVFSLKVYSRCTRLVRFSTMALGDSYSHKFPRSFAIIFRVFLTLVTCFTCTCIHSYAICLRFAGESFCYLFILLFYISCCIFCCADVELLSTVISRDADPVGFGRPINLHLTYSFQNKPPFVPIGKMPYCNAIRFI